MSEKGWAEGYLVGQRQGQIEGRKAMTVHSARHDVVNAVTWASAGLVATSTDLFGSRFSFSSMVITVATVYWLFVLFMAVRTLRANKKKVAPSA